MKPSKTTTPDTPDTTPHALSIENVSFTYSGADQPALDGVSLTVRHGEIFGLLGPNGAGKTTLIHVVSGLVKPDAGRAQMLGRSIGDPSARRVFGLCPQDLALYPALTGRENLTLFAKLAGVPRAEIGDRTCAALESVGLLESADRFVRTYSGGMKRRLNLAIAVLHEPRVVLLDEPTAGVDPQSRNLVFESLAALRARGSTIVYTTHYLEEAERFCERIAIIDHGKVLVCAERDELTSGRVRLEERFLELTGREMRD